MYVWKAPGSRKTASERPLGECPVTIRRGKSSSRKPGVPFLKNRCRMDSRYVSLINTKRQKDKDREGRKPSGQDLFFLEPKSDQEGTATLKANRILLFTP